MADNNMFGNQTGVDPQAHPFQYSLANLANIAISNANPNTEIGAALGNLGQTILRAQQMKKRKDFQDQVNSIMGADTGDKIEDFTDSSGNVVEGKMSKMYRLVITNPELAKEFGLLEPITNQYQKMKSQATSYGSPLSQGQVPEGMEVTGYDQKGKPMIRKVKRNIAEEKFNVEQVQKNKERTAAAKAVKNNAQQTLDTISEIEKGLKYFGAAGELSPWPAEYSKKNWLANVNRLKDRLVVDLMLQLKSASSSGSTGFGQLSEREGARLESAATALQKGLKEEDAQRYLNIIKKGAEKILSGEQSNTKKVGKYTLVP